MQILSRNPTSVSIVFSQPSPTQTLARAEGGVMIAADVSNFQDQLFLLARVSIRAS